MGGFQTITPLIMTTLFQAGGLDLLPKSVIGFSHCNKLIHISVFLWISSKVLVYYITDEIQMMHYISIMVGFHSVGRVC